MTYKDAEEFIDIWWQCKSLDEVCKRAGMDKRAASNLAAALRRKGVELKAFRPAVGGVVNRWLTREEVARLVEVAKAARVRARVANVGG